MEKRCRILLTPLVELVNQVDSAIPLACQHHKARPHTRRNSMLQPSLPAAGEKGKSSCGGLVRLQQDGDPVPDRDQQSLPKRRNPLAPQLQPSLYQRCNVLFFLTQRYAVALPSPAEGSLAIILPPLMGGTTCVSSLRPDIRKLEDKLASHHIELRDFCLNLDLSHIHGNRDTPGAFTAYLAVLETSLPSKGALHRATRGNPPAEARNVNVQLALPSV